MSDIERKPNPEQTSLLREYRHEDVSAAEMYRNAGFKDYEITLLKELKRC